MAHHTPPQPPARPPGPRETVPLDYRKLGLTITLSLLAAEFVSGFVGGFMERLLR